MAIPVNLYQRDSLRGAREDLIDKIFNTSPTETPLVSSFGRDTAISVYHEFQRDALGAANPNNAMIDGDDATLDLQVPTDRVGVHLQIFSKKPGVSRRANIVKKAGRGAELAYVKAKAMLELKRDMEAMVVSSNVAVASTTTIAGKSAGLGVQLYLNTSHNGLGATAAWTSGAPTVAVTAGTARAFTEPLVKSVCQSIYQASGQFVEQMVMSPFHKGLFSAFTGIATNRTEVKGSAMGKIIAAADVYVSDFGSIAVLPHYLMAGSGNVYLLNTDYIDMAMLDGIKTSDLAKTGDSERVLITCDTAMAVRSSAAQGKIADLIAA